MKCTDCKFCVFEDHGYSNWTVEGTTVYCLLDLNSAFPADRWYNEAESLNYATKCSRFSEGTVMHIDVEHENGSMLNYTDDPEVRELIEKDIMWSTLSNPNN